MENLSHVNLIKDKSKQTNKIENFFFFPLSLSLSLPSLSIRSQISSPKASSQLGSSSSTTYGSILWLVGLVLVANFIFIEKKKQKNKTKNNPTTTFPPTEHSENPPQTTTLSKRGTLTGRPPRQDTHRNWRGLFRSWSQACGGFPFFCCEFGESGVGCWTWRGSCVCT